MSASLGNRIATFAVGLLVGLVYGAIATIGHRHEVVIGGVAVPWGLVAALVGVAALLLGLRLVVGRLSSVGAAVGVIAIVALFTLPGPGGSVLIAGDVRGTIWAVAPAIVAVLVVAFPSLPDRRRTTSPPAVSSAPGA